VARVAVAERILEAELDAELLRRNRLGESQAALDVVLTFCNAEAKRRGEVEGTTGAAKTLSRRPSDADEGSMLRTGQA
jgi:hypothetical protein